MSHLEHCLHRSSLFSGISPAPSVAEPQITIASRYKENRKKCLSMMVGLFSLAGRSFLIEFARLYTLLMFLN